MNPATDQMVIPLSLYIVPAQDCPNYALSGVRAQDIEPARGWSPHSKDGGRQWHCRDCNTQPGAMMHWARGSKRGDIVLFW